MVFVQFTNIIYIVNIKYNHYIFQQLSYSNILLFLQELQQDDFLLVIVTDFQADTIKRCVHRTKYDKFSTSEICHIHLVLCYCQNCSE